MLLRTITVAIFILFSPARCWAADCWLSVHGSGLKDGTTSGDTYAASEGTKNAQICWNQTGPSDTMFVLEGEYSIESGAFWNLKINASNDGSKGLGGFKKLVGLGEVKITGSRPLPYRPEEKSKGGTWIDIARGTRDIWIQNFQVSRVAQGILANDGGNKRLRLYDLDFEDTRQNIALSGHPACTSEKECRVHPKELSCDIRIRSVRGYRYSKRHIRLKAGLHQVLVLNSHADADFLDEDFAVGFDVENPSHDIEFRNCTSRNNVYTLSEYWNGDGFKAEGETWSIRWADCSAFDNADAGFDIKTRNASLENVIALRNTRNIRTWHPQGAKLKNANASYSHYHGGEATQAGFWTQGVMECHHCTAHNNKIQAFTENNAELCVIRFYDSILSLDATIEEGELTREEKGTRIEYVRTVVWQENVQGINPEFGEGANAEWEGANREFNSRHYRNAKGYRFY